METYTFRSLWRDYWRVPVIGFFAALIAYMGSFIVAPTYVAKTKILVGRDTSIVSPNGAATGNSAGIVDANPATTLGTTVGDLLKSRAVATTVVNRLHLDRPKPKGHGPIYLAKVVFAETYKRSKAYLTAGFYKKPDRYRKAVDDVQGNLKATPLKDSYVVEISAGWDDPKIAAQIANEGAKVLVEQNEARFKAGTVAYRDFLKKQVETARTDQDARTKAVSDYKVAHNLSDIDSQLLLTTQNSDQLASDLTNTKAQLADVQSQLEQATRDLSRAQTDCTQSISTGRSTTDIVSQCPAYQDQLTHVSDLSSKAAGLQAHVQSLDDALSGAANTANLSPEQAQLATLELEKQIAQSTLATLSKNYQDAILNAASNPNNVTQLDTAVPPIYPAGPARYLFIGVGMIVGLVVGFVWSFMRAQKRRREAGIPARKTGDERLLEMIDLLASEKPATVPAGGSAPPTRVTGRTELTGDE